MTGCTKPHVLKQTKENHTQENGHTTQRKYRVEVEVLIELCRLFLLKFPGEERGPIPTMDDLFRATGANPKMYRRCRQKEHPREGKRSEHGFTERIDERQRGGNCKNNLQNCDQIGPTFSTHHDLHQQKTPHAGESCLVSLSYQLAFFTPGSSPLWAISRMQMRHRPKKR